MRIMSPFKDWTKEQGLVPFGSSLTSVGRRSDVWAYVEEADKTFWEEFKSVDDG